MSEEIKESDVTIQYIDNDLFTSHDHLGHCVSRCLRMGAGIATAFKKKFKNVGLLKSQNKRVGECAVLYREEEKRYIYYCK